MTTTSKPLLRLPDDPGEMVDQVLRALKDTPLTFCQHQGLLHRVRETPSLQIVRPSREELIYLLSTHYCVLRPKGEGLTPEQAKLIRNAPSEALEAAAIPIVDEVKVGVHVAADGRVIATGGYDAPSRAYSLVDMPMIVPDSPSEADVVAARDHLLARIQYFPFKTEVDRLNSLALPLTLALRSFIRSNVPMFACNAHHNNTGKTSLVTLLAQMTVRGVAATPPSQDREEFKKLITSKLRVNDPILIIDNIPTESTMLDSGPLQAYITSGVWSDRLLGSNTTQTTATSMVIAVTGNNLTMGAETGRRTLPIDLRPRPPRSESTPSDLELEQVDPEQFGRDQHALAVVLKHWERQGRPLGDAQMPGFSEWSRVLSGVLTTMGLPGHLLGSNQQAFRATRDVDQQEMETFFQAWWQKYGSTTVNTRTLAGDLVHDSDLLDHVLDREHARDLKIRLGKFLRSRVGIEFGPLQLHRCERDNVHNVAQYRLTNSEVGEEDH